MQNNISLSKKQQNQSLSSRKKSAAPPKNLLTTVKLSFYPKLDSEQSDTLTKLIEQLPRLKAETIKIPWEEIKNVAKKDRKDVRKQFRPELSINEDVRSNLIFGVNDVTKLLELNELSSILIANDVAPLAMVQHIICMSARTKLPVLIVQNLRAKLLSSTGISSAAIGIKKSCESPILEEIVNTATDLFTKNFPIPDHFNDFKNLIEPEVNEQQEEEEPDGPKKRIRVRNIKKEENYMLIREQPNKRVFKPVNKKIDSQIKEKEVGFMELDDDEEDKSKSVKRKNYYANLAVKRVKKNTKRIALGIPKHLV